MIWLLAFQGLVILVLIWLVWSHRRNHLPLSETPSSAAETPVEEADSSLRHLETDILATKQESVQQSRFFRQTIHELRGPLTLVLSPLERAIRQFPEAQDLQLVQRSSKRLIRILSDTLDLQRLRTDQGMSSAEPLDVVSFLSACFSSFTPVCADHGIALRKEFDEEDRPYILCEMDAIERIVSNFMMNALKFTPKGGVISMSMFRVKTHIRVVVSDNGPGIAPHDHDALFRPFSQVTKQKGARYQGSGLGLALARELAESMNGQVGVDSDLGRGARFWAEFPVYEHEKPILDVLVVDGGKRKEWTKFVAKLERHMSLDRVKRVESPELGVTCLDQNRIKCLVVCDEVESDPSDLIREASSRQPFCATVILTHQAHVAERILRDPRVKRSGCYVCSYRDGLDNIVDLVREKVDESSVLEFDGIAQEIFFRDWKMEVELPDAGSTNEPLGVIPQGRDEDPLILVVDDSGDMRTHLLSCLEPHYRVILTDSASSALEASKKHTPDLFIVDWVMPARSGFHLIKDIRSENAFRTTPVIILTALSSEETKAAGLEVGADAFLGKPFSEQELLSIVRNLLRQKSRINADITQNLLKRFLPPNIVDRIIDGKLDLEDTPKTVGATIMFVDLCDFSRISEELGPQKTASLLNKFLARMTQVIFDHGGLVDKFIGDAVMAVFGLPELVDPREQVSRAVDCALKMHEAMVEIGSDDIDGGSGIGVSIGIHQGPVLAGNFGSIQRYDYTVIGKTVNLASRIEMIAEPRTTYVSETVRDYLTEVPWSYVGSFQLKGMSTEMRIYSVLGNKIEKLVG